MAEFESLEEFKARATFYPRGKIVPKAMLAPKTTKGKNHKQKHKIVFGSDCWVMFNGKQYIVAFSGLSGVGVNSNVSSAIRVESSHKMPVKNMMLDLGKMHLVQLDYGQVDNILNTINKIYGGR